MSPTVELIFDATCPNVDAARRQLRAALARASLPAQWTEWDRAAPGVPAYARRCASPTVLVGGRDVAGDGPALDAGDGCRVYVDASGARGVPTVETIVAALAGASAGAR